MLLETYYSVVVILCGVLVAVACALLSPFLVLRRMSLVGDAISHAILPGIALGFMLTHSRQSLMMTVGAAVAGLGTVWLIELLLKSQRVREDTAVALVFPALFAVGVLLMERFAHYVDLDPECVIYGDIEFAPFDQWSVAGVPLGPRPLWLLGAVAVMNLALVVVFYKELKLTTFDPALGDALGFPSSWLHYLLMTAVALTCVAAFESVGAILVVAFLIAPAATALLLTRRLRSLIRGSVFIAALAALGGYGLAREEVLDCSVAGGMATMAGALFVLAWIVAPRDGLLIRCRRAIKL